MRRLVVPAAVLSALALSSVHWLGLLVGGIVAGLLASSWPRALAGGLGFGLLAWVAFLAILGDASRLAGYLDAGQLLYVSVTIPLGLGLIGSLAYGLKPDATLR